MCVGHVNRNTCSSHLKKTIYNKHRAYIAVQMGKTVKAPFSTHLTGAFAVDIAINNISSRKELEKHSDR